MVTGGYKIVMTERDGRWQDLAGELERKVSELMMEGWQPYFGLMILGGTRLAQVMLWEGEEEEDPPA
jgi:hypothetical protein